VAIDMKKLCFKCKCEKPLTSFHKHKQMKDGHLNKCAECVVKDVDAWRTKHPDCRAKEHARIREKQGFQTMDEYQAKRKKNAKGRNVINLQYAHKRRVQQERHTVSELDELVFIEACDVRNRRKQITGFDWHIDHIVPINYKNACGLHNAFNLQVVPASWNLKKKHTNMNEFWISGY
jgi:hypothetical protein